MAKTNKSGATRLAASYFAKFTTEILGSAVQKHKISIEDLAIIALVFTESTRPIRDDPYLASKFGFEARGLPNEYRPAVNLKFVYTSLGLSRETARRKLEKLVERGFLHRTEAGYVFLQPPGEQDFTEQFRLNLLRNMELIVERTRQLDPADQ